MVKSGVPLCYLSNAFIHIFSSVENHAIKPTHHQKASTGATGNCRVELQRTVERERQDPFLKFSLLNMIN